ncbi:MAG: hypothetical protein GQ574_00630 [Crocinitomix sp.]|nr:hypothetical protein [Crocinitomix sp.]
MKLKKLFGVLFLLALVFASCKKDGPLTPTNGIYRGVFSRIYNATDTIGTGVVFLALNEADSSFIMTGDTSSNAPYSCNGSFKLMPGKIEFINAAFITEITEDPVYDPFYVLDTVFEYEFLDTGFFLQLNLDTVVYDYKLTRF